MSWRQFEFYIDDKKIDNIVGQRIEKGANLSWAWGRGDKTFAIGAAIELSVQEMLNICLTAFIHVETMVSNLEKRAREVTGKEDAPAEQDRPEADRA